MFFLVMSIENWLTLLSIAVPFFAGCTIAFLRLKSKADKADILTEVDKKLAPLSDKVHKFELTEERVKALFKMFEKISDKIDRNMDKQEESLKETLQEIKDIINKGDEYYRGQIDKLWQNKQDKK